MDIPRLCIPTNTRKFRIDVENPPLPSQKPTEVSQQLLKTIRTVTEEHSEHSFLNVKVSQQEQLLLMCNKQREPPTRDRCFEEAQ